MDKFPFELRGERESFGFFRAGNGGVVGGDVARFFAVVTEGDGTESNGGDDAEGGRGAQAEGDGGRGDSGGDDEDNGSFHF